MLRIGLSLPLKCMPLKGAIGNSNLLSLRRQFTPQNLRQYTRRTRNEPEVRSQIKSQPTIKEKLMGAPSENAYSMGKGAAAGAAAIGLGALCYYGIGIGNQGNIYNQSMLWPQYVRDRVHSTYGYFGASCGITAASAYAVFQSPTLMRLLTKNGWMSMIGTMVLMIGSGALAQSIDYSPGIGAKQLAWAAHCAIMGAVIAPMCLLGGPILTRAALYTGGLVGGLSTVAVCAPSDKFLYMGGPLACGLGLVFASSLASMWLPPTTALGAGLASMSLYGGLILFSGFLLYDTQKIVRKAEQHPTAFAVPFDPINACLSIYMDTLNIFIRIAVILAGDGGNRRR